MPILKPRGSDPRVADRTLAHLDADLQPSQLAPPAPRPLARPRQSRGRPRRRGGFDRGIEAEEVARRRRRNQLHDVADAAGVGGSVRRCARRASSSARRLRTAIWVDLCTCRPSSATEAMSCSVANETIGRLRGLRGRRQDLRRQLPRRSGRRTQCFGCGFEFGRRRQGRMHNVPTRRSRRSPRATACRLAPLGVKPLVSFSVTSSCSMWISSLKVSAARALSPTSSRRSV